MELSESKVPPFRILVLCDLGPAAKRERIALEPIELADVLRRLAVDPTSANPAVQGLRLLTQNADAKKGIRLEILPAQKAHATAALRTLVHDPEMENPSDEPVSLIVADFDLGKEDVA